MFQIKSFTTGPSSSQKRQIRSSLERVAASREDIGRWVLFVPLDPTPEALDWFGELSDEVGFPCQWDGRSRWDALASRYPEVIDYYLGGGRSRLETRVKDLSSLLAIREQLDSPTEVQPVQVTDLIGGLVSSMNRSDPHYRYQLHVTDEPPTVATKSDVPKLVASVTRSMDDSWLTVDVLARYDYAVVDRPVPLAITLEPANDDSSREAIERFLDFGAAIDLPAGSITHFSTDLPGGLGVEGVTEGTVLSGWIGPARAGDAEGEQDLRFDLRSEFGAHLSSVVLHFGPVTVGRRGWTRSGQEVGGVFKLDLTSEIQGSVNFGITFSPSEWSGRPIRQIGEPLRFLSLLRPGNRLEIAERYGEPIGDPIEIPVNWDLSPDVMDLLRFGSNLAEIQRFVRGALVLPDEYTDAEVAEADELARLLRGERVVTSWSNLRVVMDSGSEAQSLESGPVRIRIEHDVNRQLQGLSIPLGVVGVEFASAQVERLEQSDDGTFVATLVPEGSNLCEQFIIDPPSLTAADREASLHEMREKRRRANAKRDAGGADDA